MTELAGVAHVSASHLSCLFRTGLGSPFKTFLVRLRIERAKQRLRADPRAQIKAIAADVGFADLSHFERCFRRCVGINAREYRREAAAAIGLEGRPQARAG
jgi:AraC-like DNA-binding protein